MAIRNQAEIASTINLPDSSTRTVTTLSNTTVTTNLTEDFTKVKSSSTLYAVAGDEITQTITLANNSSFEITDVTLTDTLSTGASFVSGSVVIDDVSYADYNPITGFTLPNPISATTGVSVITYKIQIDSPIAVETVTNTAKIDYTADGESFSENTNTVSITLVENELSVVKSASPNAVTTGDTITFTTVIRNDGTLKNTNVTFTDTIPVGTSFITGSVSINGTPYPEYDPATGFALPDLDVDESATVVFMVMVNTKNKTKNK